MSRLTDLQDAVTRIFFALPTSKGFYLAGGGAMLVNNLSPRPTTDLDFFGYVSQEEVAALSDDFEKAIRARGWKIERVRILPTFARFLITTDEEDLFIDFAHDSRPILEAVQTDVGPSLHPEEIAGRKMCALFGRALARDFVDVFLLQENFGIELMITRAREIDRGFSLTYLVELIFRLNSMTDTELKIDPTRIPELRRFFSGWALEIVSERMQLTA